MIARELKDITDLLALYLPARTKFSIGLIAEYQQPIFQDEQFLVEDVTTSRKEEFIAGRTMARALLRNFGIEEAPLLRQENGSPLWPKGMLGSISHKESICSVVIATEEDYFALGLDIENVEELDEDVWSVFCDSREIQIHSHLDLTQASLSNLLFSAKEAIVKAHGALTKDTAAIDWKEIHVLVHPILLHRSYGLVSNFMGNAWEGVLVTSAHLIATVVWSSKNV